MDGATPSGAALIAEALLTIAHLVDGEWATRYGEAAAEALLAHSPLLDKAPRSAGHWLAVAEAAVRGTRYPGGGRLRRCRIAAAGRRAPAQRQGTVVVGGPMDSAPLLAGQDRVRGADAAYVCRGRVPTTCRSRVPKISPTRWCVRVAFGPSRSAEQITETVHAYLDSVAKGDADRIATLYATGRDGRGSRRRRGARRRQLSGPATAVENASSQADVETLRVLGNEAAFYWALSIHGMRISIISVMTFGDDAKIASMKAYWGPENISTV
ncbi:MAG: hypothetical protein U0S13_07565 [Mycobacterium sp.]